MSRVHQRGISNRGGAAFGRSDLARLLASHGRLFSEQLGIRLNGLRSGELFKWFLACLLLEARITESVAFRTYDAFSRHRLLTPEGIAKADFGELREIMAEGHYVRYDGITSRKAQEAARKPLDNFGGELNELHRVAADAHDLQARLTEFWGVGPTTAGIFLRELRGLWAKADPPVGELALLAADHLGIADPRRFWKRRALPGYNFRHFEAALTRIGRTIVEIGYPASMKVRAARECER